MAVTNYQEAQTYLKFLPLLHDLPKQPFFIVYDAEADVLYIDFNNPPLVVQKTPETLVNQGFSPRQQI